MNIRNILKEAEQIHKHFVITPVDKAGSKYAFVCKKFYVIVLLNELGFDYNHFAL